MSLDYKKLRKVLEAMPLKFQDKSIKENVAASERVGLETKVTRTYDGVGLSNHRQCDWCLERCGVNMIRQEAEAKGAFERHPGCGCEIEYTTEKGTQRQTDWKTNTWTDVQDDDILEKRKQTGLDVGKPRFRTANMTPEDYARAVEMWNALDEYPGLSGKEKEWVYEQFDNNLTAEEKESPLVCRPFGNYRYYAVNRGHNTYKIYKKELIDATGDIVDDVLSEMFGPDWREYLDE